MRPGGTRPKPGASPVAGSQNATQGGKTMRIRAKTFRDWMKANFSKGELRELAQHGAEAGWHGLTYYSETTKLYRRFADEIWETLIKDAEEYGYRNVFQYTATFRLADVPNRTQAENLLVWYMAERTARELVED